MAQTPFDKRHEVVIGNDPDAMEYVSCPSNLNGYVAVSAFEEAGQWKLRGMDFNTDGTKALLSFAKIEYFPCVSCHIFPLKIVPLNNASGYLITGFVINNNSGFPVLFAIKTNNQLQLIPNGFRTFGTHGFFSDIDELPNGDLIFCGSQCTDLSLFTTLREGMILKTNATFTVQWMRLIDYFNPSLPANDFDIVHDLLVVSPTYAVICGNVTEEDINIGGCTATVARPFIAKIDLSTGTWVGGWINTEFAGASSTASRLSLTNLNEVVMATNAPSISASNLLFYDLSSGAFNYGKWIEFFSTTINKGTLSTHVPFIQNVYLTNTNNIFISGKFINTQKTWAGLNNFDIPFSAIYDIGTQTLLANLYVTDHYFVTPYPNLTYDELMGTCLTGPFFPFYAASNTLPAGNDEYVTVTLDRLDPVTGRNKTWIYSNDNNVCGYVNLTSPPPTDVNTMAPITVGNHEIVPPNFPHVVIVSEYREDVLNCAPTNCDNDPN